MKKYKCECCGCYTLKEEPPSTYEICEVCYWEEDYVQNKDPDFPGGANEVSLNQARKNYALFGAIEKKFIKYVRNPLFEELPENNQKK